MRRAIASLLVLVAIGFAYWQLRDRGTPEEEAEAPVPTPVPTESAPAESPPMSETPAPPSPSRPEVSDAGEALPELDVSDEVAIQAIVELVGERVVDRFVASEDVVRKAVVTTDNLARGSLPMRIRIVPALEGRFATMAEGGEIYLSPENYARYTEFARVVASLDAARAVDLYARSYPLLQEAYEELGHPGEQFHDRLIAVVDDLLSAPEPEPPIRLKESRVLYYPFADPALESLSPSQKMMVRMGPENAAIVRAKLREIRAELVTRSRAVGAGAEVGPGAG